jgi:hypothetical protein
MISFFAYLIKIPFAAILIFALILTVLAVSVSIVIMAVSRFIYHVLIPTQREIN